MEYRFIKNYRLKQIKVSDEKLNWLFLPGGLGMGSEYLVNFVEQLRLAENLYVGDFPGDGSNRNIDNITYDILKNGLIEVIRELSPCILVTHSFSGMLALTIPELENIAEGLVIMNSGPNNSWINELNVTQQKNNLPNILDDTVRFYKNPTDKNLHKLFIACIPYLFHPSEIKSGQEIIENSSFNANSRLWADQYFHPTYKNTWIPKTLPTLIIGSTNDNLLPSLLFEREKAFIKENIKIVTLNQTGHFPWITHLELINKLFENFKIKCNF
jgi:pimeloyl-ACP methyl ester carboxylesterase